MNPEELALVQALMMKSQGDPGLQAALAQINSLPEAERGKAIRILSQDYEGQRAALGSDIANADTNIATPVPKGQVAGNNPYSIYVGAGPLQHAAAAGKQIKGYRDRKKARTALDTNIKEKSDATYQTMDAMRGQSGALRNSSQSRSMQEWEEEQRRLFGGLRGA